MCIKVLSILNYKLITIKQSIFKSSMVIKYIYGKLYFCFDFFMNKNNHFYKTLWSSFQTYINTIMKVFISTFQLTRFHI